MNIRISWQTGGALLRLQRADVRYQTRLKGVGKHIYICIYVYDLCMICIQVCSSVCVYVCVYALYLHLPWISAHIYVCICIHTYTHIYSYSTRVCVKHHYMPHACMTYMHVFVHIYTHIYTHVYTHIYMCTYVRVLILHGSVYRTLRNVQALATYIYKRLQVRTFTYA